MSENASSELLSIVLSAITTDNQQGSRSDLVGIDPSETTRRPPQVAKIIKAYLQGALHDGTFSSNKRFRFSQKGTGWLKLLKRLFKTIGYNSWLYREGKTRKVYVLETLANFLDFRFDPHKLRTPAEKVSYIRGFFDAEGGIPHSNKARFYIQLVQKDRVKIEKIKTMLKSLGIDTGLVHNPSQRVDPDYWRIFVLSRSRPDFVRIIGSWHPVKRKILAAKRVVI